MFNLPEPLHPAVVHFPIVLLLVGAAVACAAVFLNRWHLPWVAAALLVLGSAGAFVAVETGETEMEMAGSLPPVAEELLDAHEEWAEQTQIVAAIAAVFALGAAGFGLVLTRPGSQNFSNVLAGANRWTMLATGARATAALGALVACFFIYQTARRGGELVYHHGVGVMASANPPTLSPSGKKESRKDDD